MLAHLSLFCSDVPQEDGIDLQDSCALIPLDLTANEALLALEQEAAHDTRSPSSEGSHRGLLSPKATDKKRVTLLDRPQRLLQAKRALSLSRQSSHQSVMSVTSAACMGRTKAISREIASLETAVVATEVQLAWQASKPRALQVRSLVSTGRQRAMTAMYDCRLLEKSLAELGDAAVNCFTGKGELLAEHKVRLYV